MNPGMQGLWEDYIRPALEVLAWTVFVIVVAAIALVGGAVILVLYAAFMVFALFWKLITPWSFVALVAIATAAWFGWQLLGGH